MKKKTLFAALGAIGLFAVGSAAQACQTAAWSDAVGAQAGDRATNGFGRFSGECGLAVDASGEYVQDNSPGAESSMTARFYMFGGQANTTVLNAFADETGTTSVFSVGYDSGAGTFSLTGTGGTSTAAAAVGDWNIVEVRLAGGTVELWVNKIAADNPADTSQTTAGSVDSVRMGALGGSVTDVLYFDDYEARRSTQIGVLNIGGVDVVSCDANADGNTNSSDALAYLEEAVSLGVNTGAADCEFDTLVNSSDALEALRVAVALSPARTY